jgi:hypothetical protein
LQAKAWFGGKLLFEWVLIGARESGEFVLAAPISLAALLFKPVTMLASRFLVAALRGEICRALH